MHPLCGLLGERAVITFRHWQRVAIGILRPTHAGVVGIPGFGIAFFRDADQLVFRNTAQLFQVAVALGQRRRVFEPLGFDVSTQAFVLEAGVPRCRRLPGRRCGRCGIWRGQGSSSGLLNWSSVIDYWGRRLIRH
ncbi:hypothetical protein D3C81_1762000 [compost metagenome]